MQQSKSWVIGGAILVAAIGVAAWLFGGPSTRDQLAEDVMPSEPAAPEPANTPATSGPAIQAKQSPTPTAATKPAAAPAAPAPPEEDDEDLFAGTMPDFMVELHARVLDKKWLGPSQQRQLYEYGKEHSDDARPQLLLAWESRNREWDGMAINLYGKAFRADSRARSRDNLRDLLDLASQHEPRRVEFTDAKQIVKDYFGASALPIVEDELAKLNASGDVVRSARLSELRDSLRGN